MLRFSAKDDSIKIWKSRNEGRELSVSLTLDFRSQEMELPPSETPDKTDVPSAVPSTVLPYIAVDVS